MIYEMADIVVTPGKEADFEAALRQAEPLFRRARGCRAMRVDRVVETPGMYRLVVEWETLEDHTVHFRASADFQQWRTLAGPFFAGPPQVIHSETVHAGFGRP
jgi:heme-degrading monooxygenase HmoA